MSGQSIKRQRLFARADEANSEDSVDDGSTISLARLRSRVRGAETGEARLRLRESATEIARLSARLAVQEQLQAQVAAQALTLTSWAAAFDATALLQRAVDRGDVADVRTALALGGAADVEAVSPARWGGRTMLMYACFSGKSEVVRELLEAGADKYKVVIGAGGELHTARRSADRCALTRRNIGLARDDTILELLDASLRPPQWTEAARDRAGFCTLTGATKGIYAQKRGRRKIFTAVVSCLRLRDNFAVVLSCRGLWSPKALIYRDAPDEQLRRVCTSGDMTLVRRLLSRDDCEALMASFGDSGETALMRACRAGRVAIAKLLLLKGANKHTALFREAAVAHLPRYDAFTFAGLADDPAARAQLRELLDASQRAPALRQGGEHAPTLTGDSGVLTIVAPVLLKYLTKRDQYSLAVTSRATWRHVPAGMSAEDAQKVRQGSYLWWSIFNGIRYDADTDDDDEDEQPMLAWAAAKGDLQLVRELLDWRASADATWDSGRTALSEALRRGHLDIAAELIARGASVNAPVGDFSNVYVENPPGDIEHEITPLILAIAGGFIAFAHDLITRGADVNARPADHCEPALAKAVRHGNVGLVRALIDKGANLEAAFEHEQPEFMDEPIADFTSLRLACRLGRADIVRLLLAAGAVEVLVEPDDMSLLGDAYAMAGEGAAGTRAAVLAALQGR